MDHYQIDCMTQAEVNIAIDWAAKEGWNPGLHDALCFYKTDPNGFFVGKLNGTIIAMGSAVIYDERFAFCGFYIVDKAYRDKGYGLELTRARLNYIGDRNAGIDGVVNMLDKYARLGYQLAHNNARYRLDAFIEKPQSHPQVLPISTVDFSELSRYDRLHFPAYREQFLKCWVHHNKALGFIEDGTLKGYGVIRACREGFKIGPLFADSPEIATTLFNHLAQHAQGRAVFLDIPENNPLAVSLVNRYKMDKIFATARMYLKNSPDLPIHNIYGITTFELG